MPEEANAHVSFLKKHPGFYTFPVIADESSVSFHEIKKVLPEPRYDRHGHLFFIKPETKEPNCDHCDIFD